MPLSLSLPRGDEPGQSARDPASQGRAVAGRDAAARTGRCGPRDRRRARRHQPRRHERQQTPELAEKYWTAATHAVAAARESSSCAHRIRCPAKRWRRPRLALTLVDRTGHRVQAPALQRGGQADFTGRPAADGWRWFIAACSARRGFSSTATCPLPRCRRGRGTTRTSSTCSRASAVST